MRTFVNFMPGEKRSCIGCHEPRQLAPARPPARPLATQHPVEELRPQPGDTKPRAVHYAADVVPILQRRCVGCHGGKEPAGGLALTSELTGHFDKSYENLLGKNLVGHVITSVSLPPLTFGSHQSGLVRRIREAPCNAGLTREEFIRIVTWVDADVPYYGTHDGKKNLIWKDDVEFRPLPP
jgi:hypothetical protein